MAKHSKKHRPKGKGHKSGFMDLKRGIWYAEVRAQQEWHKREQRSAQNNAEGGSA